MIGAISLRTRGVYFIMITLAFAQMMFYLVNSLKGYGGDEGLTLPRALAALGVGARPAATSSRFYYVVLAVLALALLRAAPRFAPSRFGRAVLALRDNEVRAEALGFPIFRYKLVVLRRRRRARAASPAR